MNYYADILLQILKKNKKISKEQDIVLSKMVLLRLQ